MSEDTATSQEDTADSPKLLAYGCVNGHFTHPSHSRCPSCGEPQTETADLTSREATVVTWTRVTSTPPGVREPNILAIVEFSLEPERVRVLGGATEEVTVGDEVRPVYVDRLRDPEQSVREGTAQSWDGFRFEPV